VYSVLASLFGAMRPDPWESTKDRLVGFVPSKGVHYAQSWFRQNGVISFRLVVELVETHQPVSPTGTMAQTVGPLLAMSRIDSDVRRFVRRIIHA
jgi:hypothetical protein